MKSALQDMMRRPGMAAWGVVTMAGVFVLDMLTPLGFVPWLLYLAPIWIVSRFSTGVLSLSVAAVCAGLTLVGWVLSSPGLDPSLALINRIVGVGLFGLVAFFFHIQRGLEQRLREQAVSLRAVVDHLYEGLITIDEWGTVESFNPAAERIFGYAADEVIGRNVSLLMPEPDRSRHDRYLANYLSGSRATIIGIGREVIGQRKDGSSFPMELGLTEMQLNQRRVFIGSVRDITERKRMEQQLAQSRDFYLSLLQDFPAMIWRAGLDAKCDYFNRTWLTFTGRALEQELGDGWAEGVHSDDVDRCVAHYLQAFRAREPFVLEYRLRRADGAYRSIVDHGRPFLDMDGQFAGYIGACFDITERKWMEERLQKSQMRFEVAVRGTNDGIWDWDILGNEKYWSDRCYELIGYQPGEFAAGYNEWAALMHPDDRERVLGALRQHLERHLPYDIEYRLRTKSGTYRWIHAKGQAMWNAAGQPVRMAGSLSDVTARREAVEALADSRARFQAILDAATEVSIIATDPAGVITTFNAGAERMLGYRADDMIGKWTPELIHLASEVESRGAQLSRELGKPVQGFDVFVEYARQGGHEEREWTYVRKDGAHRTVSLVVTALCDGHGVSVGFLGIARDITNYKQAELLLRQSEEFTRTTLDALSAHIAILDATGTILAVNQAWREFASANDAPPDRVSVGANYLAVCEAARDSQALAFAAGIRAVIRGDLKEFVGEYPCHSPSARRWFIGRVTRFQSLRPVRIVVAHENITQRKLTEEALRESQVQYQLLVKHANDIMYRTDSAGRFVFVNPPACRIMQFSEQELIGMRFTELIRSDRRLDADRFYGRQFIRKTASTYYEFPAVRKDGSELCLGQHVQILVEHGEVIGFQAVARDITERTHLEETLKGKNAELSRRTEELAVANEDLEAYAHMVSHDLRAPLQAMAGYAGLLQRRLGSAENEKAVQYLAKLNDTIRWMGRLIEDLLVFSESSHATLRRQPVNLDEVLQHVIEVLHPQTKERTVEWRIAPLPVVSGDTVLLHQAVLNLIGNALKYTGHRPTAIVEVGAMAGTDGAVTIFVKDNGVGFDMAKADRLFQPFNRLHNQSQFDGTGVGLATVRRIVERHGGRVWAESAVDRGATFYVALEPVGDGNAATP